MNASTSTIVDTLVTKRFNRHNVFEAFEFLEPSTAIFFAFLGVGWLEVLGDKKLNKLVDKVSK
jgi:hypothetical protein